MKGSNLAPVVIFVYARPKHTKKMLEALEKNHKAKDTEVFVFSDSAKNEKKLKEVNEVREIIHEYSKKNAFKGFTIFESEKNKGLANSIISGVTEIIDKYGKAIVLEDDLIPSKTFIEYMNNALNFYENDKRIWSVSGYNWPINIPDDYKRDLYISYRGCSWGWATWKDRWKTVDWDVSDYEEFKHNYKKRREFNRGGNELSQMLDAQMNGTCDSWAVRWYYEQYKQGKYTVFPVKSLIQNEGMDGSGTHSGTTHEFDVILSDEIPKMEENLLFNKIILKNFKKANNKGIKQLILELMIMLRIDNIVYKYRKWRKNRK